MFWLCSETKATWLHSHKKASPVPERQWLEKKPREGCHNKFYLLLSAFEEGSPHKHRGMNSKRKISHERSALFLQNIPACRPGFTLERETRLQVANSVPYEPSFITAACHFNFSHHIPTPLLSRPVHGERKGFPCCDSGLFRQQQTSHHASCISWHNISRAMRQLKATDASSQSPRKRDIFSPDQFCPITFRARLSTLCSY